MFIFIYICWGSKRQILWLLSSHPFVAQNWGTRAPVRGVGDANLALGILGAHPREIILDTARDAPCLTRVWPRHQDSFPSFPQDLQSPRDII